MGFYGRRRGSKGPSPRCKEVLCGHSKRKHSSGYYCCNATGCNCKRFLRITVEERKRLYREEPQEYIRKNKEEALNHTLSKPVDFFRYSSFLGLLNAALEKPLCTDNLTGYKGWEYFTKGGSLNSSFDITKDTDGTDLASIGKWLARGWPYGVKKMKEALGQIKAPQVADVRRHGVWSDVGDTLNLDRLYAGSVETCWRTSKRSRCGAPPRVQIIMQGATPGGYSQDQLFWKGAAGATLTEALCAAGYAVALDNMVSLQDYTVTHANYLELVRVKDYGSPVNLSILTSVSAHPSSFRIVSFAHIKSRAFDKVESNFGYCDYPSIKELEAREFTDRNSVVIIIPCDVNSQEKAKQWIEEQVAMLEKIGKPD